MASEGCLLACSLQFLSTHLLWPEPVLGPGCVLLVTTRSCPLPVRCQLPTSSSASVVTTDLGMLRPSHRLRWLILTGWLTSEGIVFLLAAF